MGPVVLHTRGMVWEQKLATSGLHTGFGARGGQIELPKILGGGSTIWEFIGVQRPGVGGIIGSNAMCVGGRGVLYSR